MYLTFSGTSINSRDDIWLRVKTQSEFFIAMIDFLIDTFNFKFLLSITGPEISCTDFKFKQFGKIRSGLGKLFSREGTHYYTRDYIRIIWQGEAQPEIL